MLQSINRFLDKISEFLAPRKGLLPIIAICLISINFIFRLFPTNWFSTTDFLLHLGIILAIFGFMIAWAL
jgi:hypothetical protein